MHISYFLDNHLHPRLSPLSLGFILLLHVTRINKLAHNHNNEDFFCLTRTIGKWYKQVDATHKTLFDLLMLRFKNYNEHLSINNASWLLLRPSSFPCSIRAKSHQPKSQNEYESRWEKTEECEFMEEGRRSHKVEMQIHIIHKVQLRLRAYPSPHHTHRFLALIHTKNFPSVIILLMTFSIHCHYMNAHCMMNKLFRKWGRNRSSCRVLLIFLRKKPLNYELLTEKIPF